MAFTISSRAFRNGTRIPSRYTCEGDDLSPPLSWRDAPNGTRSYVLICEDPDSPSGLWTHWLVYDIPGDLNELEEGLPRTEILPNGAKQGLNTDGEVGYSGPCPPRGRAHRYVFRILAVSSRLPLRPASSRKDLEEAVRGLVIARAEIVGLYGRPT